MTRGLVRRYGCGNLRFITCSCYRRLPLLRSVRARNHFVQILGEVRGKFGFALVGYVPDMHGRPRGYNFLLHNSNSFVYNMLNSDPAGRIPPPSAPVFTPGYAMKPDDWYPKP